MQDSNKVNKSSAQQGEYYLIRMTALNFHLFTIFPSNKYIVTVETFYSSQLFL